jgi:hypothetical protein
MKQRFIRSSTIMELLVSMVILSILVIVFAAIDIMSQTHVLTVDRRARVQNDLVYILEHSTKYISKAIGNAKINKITDDGDQIIRNTVQTGDGAAIEFYIDVNGNGKRDDDPTPWRAYRFRSAGAANEYEFWWCPKCSSSDCDVCDPVWGVSADNTLSKRVTGVTYAYNAANAYVDVTVQGCWDPKKVTTSDNCGTSEKNPAASLTARIRMPSVSTQ